MKKLQLGLLKKLLKVKDKIQVMDLEEIKKIIKINKSKIIIVENGKPLFVISPYEETKEELSERHSIEQRNFSEDSEFRGSKEKNTLYPKELEEDTPKLEDLPL